MEEYKKVTPDDSGNFNRQVIQGRRLSRFNEWNKLKFLLKGGKIGWRIVQPFHLSPYDISVSIFYINNFSASNLHNSPKLKKKKNTYKHKKHCCLIEQTKTPPSFGIILRLVGRRNATRNGNEFFIQKNGKTSEL